MDLRSKCWRDLAEHDDGERLLVSRFLPRGPAKIDRWERRLAPSMRLDFALHRRWITWREYAGLYLAEMWGRAPLLHELGDRAQMRPVTLLCSCSDVHRCHRDLLVRIVQRLFAQDAPVDARDHAMA
jgi:uncharacterized protein YeaO (DUF488 family)